MTILWFTINCYNSSQACDVASTVHEVAKTPGSSSTHHTIIVLLTDIGLSAVPVDVVQFLHTLKLYHPLATGPCNDVR